ncbi:MAG: VTT domain-containing protein [Bdellovibrionales bacterium]|nr:VTT domain-containing protein [Bdellovibrionales bacterium]
MMQTVLDFLRSLHSADGIQQLIRAGGLAALTAIIFAETGLLAGFFLPGDSLLVTAGIFAASDGMGGAPLFHVGVLCGVLSMAAVIGDQLGYVLGVKTGSIVAHRPDSLFFKKKHLAAAHEFYERHGAKALVLARFAPIFRTFVPFAAGMAGMNYGSFVRYNVIGGLLWVNSMVLIGYGLGHSPLADQVHKIIVVVVFLSILPILISAAKAFLAKRRAA